MGRGRAKGSLLSHHQLQFRLSDGSCNQGSTRDRLRLNYRNLDQLPSKYPVCFSLHIEQTHGPLTLSEIYLKEEEFLKAKFNKSGLPHYTRLKFRLKMLASFELHRSVLHACLLCTFSSEKWLCFVGCLSLFNICENRFIPRDLGNVIQANWIACNTLYILFLVK